MRWALNCSILFQEVPTLERPAAAAAAGFRHIEFWWPFPVPVPADRDVDAFVSAVESAGVDLIGLNFAAGDMPGGDRGLVSWVGRELEFRDSVAVASGIAARLGTRAFNALYGNRVDGVDAAAQDELAVENLAYAAKQVEPLGGTVLVEPVSGAPRYPLRTAADVLAVIDRVPAGNVRLLADLYHLATNGDDVPAVIARDIDRIGHVQIADSPGRHEPGTGELDIAGHLAALAAGGYDGYAALEFSPATTTAAGLAALDLTALLP
jgi:hydroxypyruvate isomerase